MPDLIYLIAVLVCPIMMGAMMLVMMRGNHNHHPPSGSSDEVARLRAEVQQLRAERPVDQAPNAS
ncbi:hypothetical protein [Nocardioides speluncae]|uniref:hypothetical protein n=1 Tax=Nocardioides speluncae TaxID=2670337 RepID=UPI000D69498B|nr:hypothetical protein [Nocardioides speluncae]